MKKCFKILALFLALFLGSSTLVFCQTADIAGLVDNFHNGTDLQKGQMQKDNQGKDISGSGIVSNVGEYDFFDVTNDIKGIYYQVTTDTQKTANSVPYQLIFLFKDRDQVKEINKGENFQRDGKIIRVLDERLQIAVWIFCGDLTDSDKALFKQN